MSCLHDPLVAPMHCAAAPALAGGLPCAGQSPLNLSEKALHFKRNQAMTASLLQRLVRAIAEGTTNDLVRLTHRIIDDERRKGHHKLADQLSATLKQSSSGSGPSGFTELPMKSASNRNASALTTTFMPESLEHHTVFRSDVEQRFVRIEREFAARDRLGKFGLQPSKTILLYGPPGCGKSLGAKRLAWTTGLPLVKIRFESLMSSLFGESAANLRTVFASANERPCLLLLDECDFIARSRTNSKDVGEAARIVNSLLHLMEEYEAPGLLVATTNIQGALDKALFRRFDEIIEIPPPGHREIVELLQLTLSAIEVTGPVDWHSLISELGGASCAMVVKAARDAAKAAILSGGTAVTEALLIRAIADLHIHSTVEVEV